MAFYGQMPLRARERDLLNLLVDRMEARVSAKELGKKLGCSETLTRRLLDRLEYLGYIEVQRVRGSAPNVIKLLR